MARFFVIAAILGLSVLSSYADPIFMSSQRKIEDVSASPFMDSDGFLDVFSSKFLQKGSTPKAIIVFNINLNDKKLASNPSLAIGELAPFSFIQDQFKASPNTYSSAYIKEALSSNFNHRLFSTIQNSDFVLSENNLKDFSLTKLNELSKGASNVLSVTHLTTSDLPQLNNILNQYQSSLGRNSDNNNLVLLKFTDNTSGPNAQTLLSTQGTIRNLAGEQTGQTTVGVNTMGISSGGLAGILISIFALFAVYIGFMVMTDIKTPSRFFKDTLQIGKEH